MEPPTFPEPPKLAWKWILEKLADVPDFGVAFFNKVITSHISDIEEPRYQPLLEKVALRNLEEMIVTNQIDSDAIPLLKAIIGQNLPTGTTDSFVKQRFNKELILSVQTEVVLSVLREDVDEGETDWAFYESELERVFGEAEEDNRLLDRKRELSALLHPKNQTKVAVAAYFKKYPLNKLRNDFYSFINEKRESFKTTFLDQLSRDFLVANGEPFSEDLGNVEKSTKVEANGKQDHVDTVNVKSLRELGVRDYQEVGRNEIGDQHGTSTVTSKKRRRRKLFSTQNDIGDDESEEAEEGSTGMKKSRIVPSTSIVYPIKTLLREGVSEPAVPASGPQLSGFPEKQGVESCMQLSLLKRGEEPLSGLRNLGPGSMRSFTPAAHESISLEGAKILLREPSLTNKCVVISDVGSDAETQVAQRLSTNGEDCLIEKDNGDIHNMKRAQYFPENGSDRGHPQDIVETEVVRKETITVQSERKTLVDRRKEASTGSPEIKANQQEDNEKFVTKNEFIPLDSQDTSDADLLEVGSDGHEEVCHICGKHGKLLWCDGCPISLHLDCIKVLGVRLPKSEDWYCPACLSLKAAREAAEAEKVASAAKEKLKAFKMERKKRQSSPLRYSRQEKTIEQSSRRISSLESGENDMTLKPKQQSDEEPDLRYTEGQLYSHPSKASLLSTALRKALRQQNQSGEQESNQSLPEDKPRVVSLGQGIDGKNVSDVGRAIRANKQQLVNASPKSLEKNRAGSIRDGSAKPVSRNGDVRSPHTTYPSHDQGVSRRGLLAAIISEQVKRGIEGDKDDEDLDEDRGEKSEGRNQGAMFSGRQKLPGLRRKPLPWTRQEESTLKEGVRRFSHSGVWGFQWKRILEFGQGKFDPSRTDGDLKDKWRNLMKSVS